MPVGFVRHVGPHATFAAAYREVFGRLRAPRRYTPAVAQVRTVLVVPSVVSKYAWRQLHGIVPSFGERTLASGLGPRSHLFPAFETSGKERGVTVDGSAQFVAVRTRERDTGQLPAGFAERPEHRSRRRLHPLGAPSGSPRDSGAGHAAMRSNACASNCTDTVVRG